MTRPTDDARLPQIPVVDLAGAAPPALVDHLPEGAEALLSGARRQYTGTFCGLGGRLSRRWLARTGNPYRDEIGAVAARLGGNAACFLNLSYEWGCTTATLPAPDGRGTSLLRALDWPFHGLGRHVAAVRQTGPAGDFLNLTWPGFVGVIQGVAAGRFAAAINQAPMPRRQGRAGTAAPMPVDWFLNRLEVARSDGLPAPHLLRQAFETCPDYASARHLLATARLCIPAIFVLSGSAPGEGCVIERSGGHAAIHEAPQVAANHWLDPRPGPASPRGTDSEARRDRMTAMLATPSRPFGWLVPPVLNGRTRLVLEARAATGEVRVQGWERDGPATAILEVSARSPGGAARP